eukprot:817511_1
MGCGGSSEELIDINLSFTPTELGDFILDMEQDKINKVFENKDSKPKRELVHVLQLSLYYYLLQKNQRANSNTKPSVIENQMQRYKNDELLGEKLEPIAKW